MYYQRKCETKRKEESTNYIKQNGCNEGTPAGHECLRINSDEIETEINQQQCNLDFVTLLISAKTVTNCIMSLNRMILCCKWKTVFVK